MRSTRRGAGRGCGCFILVLILMAGAVEGVSWYISDSLQCGGLPSSECNRSADASKGETLRIIGAPGGSVDWTVTGIESVAGDWHPVGDVILDLHDHSGAFQQTLRPALDGASDWGDSISTGENDTSQMIIEGTIVVPNVPNGVTVLDGTLHGNH